MFWTKKFFESAGDVVVTVRDVAAARNWYTEKLDLTYSSSEVEEADLEMGYSPEEIVVYIMKASDNESQQDRDPRPPIIISGNLAKAHKFLISRNVDIGPVQSDSGDNQFFRFRDLDGNELEVCQDH